MWLYKIKGFVLPLLLIFMQVLMLLSLSLLQDTFLESKMARQDWENHQFSNQLAVILERVENNLPEHLQNCAMTLSTPDTLKNAPLSWWQNHSCADIYQSIEYYYVIETLGVDPCASIVNTKGQVADYYRVTLLGIDKSLGSKKLIQSTEVLPFAAQQQCTDKNHHVMIGRQTWREIGG